MNNHALAQGANPPQFPISLLRIPVVMARTGLCRASLYKRISAGLFPRPVKAFGRQRAGWPSDEVETLIRAHVAGASESRIAELVAELHAHRGGPSQASDHTQHAA
jgi:prophage regulatory protein